MQAYAPNGKAIEGTLETCPGRADIAEGSFVRDQKTGEIDFQYAGWTEFFYDDQKSVVRQHPQNKKIERVYLDTDGNEWLESELVLKEGGAE